MEIRMKSFESTIQFFHVILKLRFFFFVLPIQKHSNLIFLEEPLYSLFFDSIKRNKIENKYSAE